MSEFNKPFQSSVIVLQLIESFIFWLLIFLCLLCFLKKTEAIFVKTPLEVNDRSAS